MKRFLFTLLFCSMLLFSLLFVLFPLAGAAENPILQLLDLPAPPPPNPDVVLPPIITQGKKFYSKSNPPGDDAPIEVLMDYWRTQSSTYNALSHKVYPSDRVLGRLMDEFRRRPEEIVDFLNIFPKNRSAEFVKRIYDDFAATTSERRELRSAMRRWMKFNTPYFSTELAREAAQVADEGDYVSNHDALIALARVDWERAGPIASRLYNNGSQKASQTAALWALYVHALESGDTGDTERYREELKKVIADRSLSAGVRDLALDALSLEKEWSGRDDWYISLMEDETMLDLGRFTGLTTLITNSPEEKYIDRMIALLESDNINVRSAAARNLLMRDDHDRADVLKALLPWLEDPKWLKEVNQGSRQRLVQALAQQKIPESVPALIAALDEKATRPSPSLANTNAAWSASIAANSMANAANIVANVGNMNTSRANRVTAIVLASNTSQRSEVYFPLRDYAVAALAFQADGRAVPALRKLLNELSQNPGWAQRSVITALYACGGYSISEQVDAIEDFARKTSTTVITNSNAKVYPDDQLAESIAMGSATDMLVFAIVAEKEVSDDLARGVVDRIVYLEDKEPVVSEMLRGLAMKWKSIAMNSLLLRDLKRNRFSVPAVVRLLAERKTIREKQMTEVSELRTANAIAYAISACLLEDPNGFTTILDSTDNEAKGAMLACARLIRAPLPVPEVAEYLKSQDKVLKLAAERYLESEDSPDARAAVLAIHPGEARILGATTAFFLPGRGFETMLPALPFISDLFATVNEYYARGVSDFVEVDRHKQLAEIETKLQRELTANVDLLGVYNWRENYIHIYKDKAIFSWHDDPARFRERPLAKEEFDNFKEMLTRHRAADLPPFLSCFIDGCQTDQLLMMGRNGGRRVFVKASSLQPLFAELDQMFEGFRRAPSTVKYLAAKDVPGLQLLFADDRLDAIAAWKNGADFRLLTADKLRKAEIAKEVEIQIDALEQDSVEWSITGAIEDLRRKREYESYAWFNFAGGAPAGEAMQPNDVPYIPVKDNLVLGPDPEQWKTQAGAIEIRANDEGLYKIANGRATQIKKGVYRRPVVSPNGRWVVVTKLDDEVGVRVIRVNLLTGREFPVATRSVVLERAIAFVPSINRVIIGPSDEEYDGHYDEEQTEAEQVENADGGGYWLLDPETGGLIPARGELRPLVQQTFRPLQPASAPFEYWAAVAEGSDTVIGVYNSRTFTIKPLVKLPKISFDSMDLWVDGTDGKAYFVYEGHLLAVPLKAAR